MVKYKKYFQKMLEDNGEIFNSFKNLHDNYALNPQSRQLEFNTQGKKVLKIIREYENRLCSDTERGVYSKYSARLAEKFQNEIRAHFPMVDRIGLTIDKPGFAIKKINLF